MATDTPPRTEQRQAEKGPESAPRQATELANYKMLIGGKWCSSESDDVFDVINPYTREVWATAPAATASDVHAAVSSARRAFEEGEWSRSTPRSRAVLLRRLAQLLDENSERLAICQVKENGKVIREMLGQARLLPAHFDYYAGLAETLHGTTTPISIPDQLNYTIRQPLGVVAAITPWNSPLMLLAWKAGPALAAGNTLVIKPSEITPISTLLFAQLTIEAGFPEGVVNVVTGFARPTGQSLVAHPQVAKIAFTGSTTAGAEIAATGAKRLARVSLELGGKSPNIVFEDANQEDALAGVVAGIFGAAGQTCMAGSRILVQRSIYDDFCLKLASRARSVKLGDPMDPQTEMATIAHEGQFNKILQYIEIGKQEGARLLAGGHATAATAPGGLFVEPTLFAEVTNSMRVVREEIFGPVGCILQFDDEADAIRLANDTPFGLAAGVWTRDVKRAHRVAHRLQAGTVWINSYRKTNYVAPFGGFKESGMGRENGVNALEEYTEMKSILVDIGNGAIDPFNPRAYVNA